MQVTLICFLNSLEDGPFMEYNHRSPRTKFNKANYSDAIKYTGNANYFKLGNCFYTIKKNDDDIATKRCQGECTYDSANSALGLLDH